ncbi:hypothetical protein TruAng_008315 [Truncatella angustata]|nr:hypothetical protein TruAng_008315 [Truncatella angustata]
MAGYPSESHELDALAAYNDQGLHGQYNSPPQYGSPMPNSMSPYNSSSYPDPTQAVSSIHGYLENGLVKMEDVHLDKTSIPFCRYQDLRQSTADIAKTQNPHGYTGKSERKSSSPHPSSASTTRSGRTTGTSDPLRPRPARVQKAPASKSKRRRNQARTTPPTVVQPLSELLAYMDPSKDKHIGEYVNRSLEERIQEATAADGRIKRPMNAFMLYRKGWQNRIKEMQSNENHQGVSRVAGDGWALEPEHIRNQFNKWSEVERDMHAQAFPNYKFKPQKTDKKKNAKTGYTTDGDESDLESYSGNIYVTNDDPDGEYRPPGGRVSTRSPRSSNKNNYQQHAMQPPSRATSHSPYPQQPQYPHRAPTPLTPSMSHYQYNNPGKPLPAPYPVGGHEQYYQQHVERRQQQRSYPPNSGYTIPPQSFDVHDVYFRQTERPQYQYMSQSPPQQEMISHSPSPVQQQYDCHNYYPADSRFIDPPQMPPHLYSQNHMPTQASRRQTQQQQYHQQQSYVPLDDAARHHSVAPLPPVPAGTPNNINEGMPMLETDYSAGMWDSQSVLFGGQGTAVEDPATTFLNFGDSDLGYNLDPNLDPSLESNLVVADGPEFAAVGDYDTWTVQPLSNAALSQPDNHLDTTTGMARAATTTTGNLVVDAAAGPPQSQLPPPPPSHRGTPTSTTAAPAGPGVASTPTPTSATFIAGEHLLSPTTPTSAGPSAATDADAGDRVPAELSVPTPKSMTSAHTPATVTP